MASKIDIVAILATFVVAIATSSRATEHVVGDDQGWTLGFNYTAWAQGKEFRVGDTLVFKYVTGEHNVFKVSGPQFWECDVPPADEALTTGNDVITLATAGRKWYICGVGNGTHCVAGQKLAITVVPEAWQRQAPSPSPSSMHASRSHPSPPSMAWEGPASSPVIPGIPLAPGSSAPSPSESDWFLNRFFKY